GVFSPPRLLGAGGPPPRRFPPDVCAPLPLPGPPPASEAPVAPAGSRTSSVHVGTLPGPAPASLGFAVPAVPPDGSVPDFARSAPPHSGNVAAPVSGARSAVAPAATACSPPDVVALAATRRALPPSLLHRWSPG